MQGVILLDYGENTHQVEEEEKTRFLKSLLEQMFENTEVFSNILALWPEDHLSVENKVKLRSILNKWGIVVIDSNGDCMKVLLDNEEIAIFNKPFYKLKKDLQVRDPKKRIFVEMHINCWSKFDEPSNEEI
jgi:hypothetical protein